MYTRHTGLKLTNGRSKKIAQADSMPITVQDLQAQLRVDNDETYLESLIMVASDYAEKYMGRSLSQSQRVRQWDLYEYGPQLQKEHASRQDLELTYPPVQSVDKVESVTYDGDTIELTNYIEDLASEPARVVLREVTISREIASIRVEYTAGYDALPSVIKQGILMHAAYLYEHRGECDAEDAGKLSGAHGLYSSYRVTRV